MVQVRPAVSVGIVYRASVIHSTPPVVSSLKLFSTPRVVRMGRPQMFPVLSAILCLSLLLPALHCNNNLLCYYSPIMYRNKTFDLILTECPPTELCMTGNGRYGNHSALSTRGCMAPTGCGQVHPLPLKGTVYTMTYACCDYNYCNAGHRVAVNSVPLVVAMTMLLLTGL